MVRISIARTSLGLVNFAAIALAAVFPFAACGPALVAGPPNAEAAKVRDILTNNCFRCHGKEGTAEGGMNFILHRDKLLAAKHVVPSKPGESMLVDRLASADNPMPPAGENPRPSADDIKTIVAWVESGAPEFGDAPRASFVSNEIIYKGLRADLAKVNKNDAKFMRYFSVMHLRTCGLTDDEIATYRLALGKLLNSLSWNRKLVALKPVDKYNTVFRVDLRDLKWTADIWDSIARAYPYVQLVDTREALGCRTITESDVPLIRADWFIAAASRPPLYHELLQLPESDVALERLLKVDVAKDIRERTCTRVAFARSGVSQNNRMIERHESIFGPYWRSYDFASSSGDKNLFQHPLGPGGPDGFRHDGGEIIFTLPNGMLAFMLVDGVGRRVDRGPATIVSDPRQPDRAVVNGASCMTCHNAGVLRKADEIRPQVEANRTAFHDPDTILALYADSAATDKLLAADAKAYQDTLSKKEIGMTRLSNSGEPISVVAERYRDDVDAPAAAAELGVEVAALPKLLSQLSTQDLVRAVGPLKSGGIIKRDSFENAFHDLVGELKLGSTALVAQTQQKPKSIRNVDRRDNVDPVQDQAATQELQAGISAINKGDRKQGQAKLEEALRLAPDDAFRIRAYEQLLPIYERLPTVDKLVEAHRFIINASQGEGAQQQAIDAFFRTIAAQSKGGQFYDRNMPPIALFSNVKVPVSTATVITSQFEQDLTSKNDHEPTLRVLATVYRFIAPNDQRRREILEQLQTSVTARHGKLDVVSLNDLASLYVAGGDTAKGIALFEQFLKENPRDDSAGPMLIDLAIAWQKSGDRNKALTALGQVEKVFTTNAAKRDSLGFYQLIRVGDLYFELEARDQAAKIYRIALASSKDSNRTAELQKKLASATGQDVAAADAPLDKLLDPSRRFRQQAEKLQSSNGPGNRADSGDLTRAAENWLKAGEKEKALAAAKQAESDLRKPSRSLQPGDDRRRPESLATLADVFRQLNEPQRAASLLVEALKQSTEERDITRYQQQLSALTADSSVDTKVPADELKSLLDEKFKYRTIATHLEKDEARDAFTAVKNLIHAADLWSKSGDDEQGRRVAKLAADKLKRPRGPDALNGRLYSDLASLYVRLGDPKTAVDQLVQAINVSNSEYDAKDLKKELTKLCEANNLPVPELNAAAARKLDPLTKFRTRAEEAETHAKETPALKSHFLMDAAENWAQAEEKERGLAALKKAAAESKKSRSVGNDYEKIAELFAKLGDTKSAKQYYKLAIDNTTSKFRKKDLQQALDNLTEPAEQ